MSKFKVTITRTETYTLEVDVDAENEEQAEAIVRQREQNNEFAEKFGCPDDVETHFAARDMGDPNRTYTLPELADKVDIDVWVEGISAMCNMDAIRKEVYDMAGMVEDEDNPICPGEFEKEYTELADKYKFRFNRKGQIVSFNLNADKEADKDKERQKTMKNNKKMTPVYPFKRFDITAKVDWDFDEGETPPDPKFEVSFTPEELMNEDILDKGGIDDVNKWFIDEEKLGEFLGDYLTNFTDFCHKGFTFEWDYVK